MFLLFYVLLRYVMTCQTIFSCVLCCVTLHYVTVIYVTSCLSRYATRYAMLCCDVMLHYILLYYITSYHIISYHIISYHVMSSHVMSCYIILYYIILYYIICYILLCYVTLFYVNIITIKIKKNTNSLIKNNYKFVKIQTIFLVMAFMSKTFEF